MVNLTHAGSGLFAWFILGVTRSTVIADPCPPEVKSFKITTTQDASDLATALNCSGGGFFDVQWEGSVIVEHTFALTDASIMNITGVGSGAVADGNGAIQLFRVSNAVLNFADIGLENGNAANGELYGGAVWASGHTSVVSWSGTNTLTNNIAFWGGAVAIEDGAKAFWTGRTNFTRNTGINQGGVLFSEDGSLILSGETSFSDTIGGYSGGTIDAHDSVVSWSGVTSFKNSTLDFPFESGGTVEVYDSVLSWTGETYFNGGNGGKGGALFSSGSSVSWGGETVFCDNVGGLMGGALFITGNSTVSWTGQTHFCNNRAGDAMDNGFGGAVRVEGSSIVMTGSTTFTGNYARTGGAVYVGRDATMDWDETTNFTNNSAVVGGALYGDFGAQLRWGGEITFTENTASENGGAFALGGEMSLDMTAVGIKLIFTGNNANIAGGAVYQSGIGVGLTWTGVTFVSNFALNGGAVYSVASGTALEQDGDNFHSKYIDCIFRDNSAEASGGAVESAAGKDDFFTTTFDGNTAGAIGGALRMAGTTNLTLCEFVGNGANETGPAVASVGTIVVSNISFENNGLLCAPGAFLNYSIEGSEEPDQRKQEYYGSVCEGCGACTGCTWAGEGIQECIPALENTDSVGVDAFGVPITLETLEIKKGFWRPVAHTSSIFPCWNPDACLKGITDDMDDCADGYKGPYCAICKDGYAPTLAYTCAKCSSGDGITFAVLTLTVGVLAVVAASFYLVSEPHQTETTLFRRLRYALPVQGLKTVVVAWQILTQFDSVANVTYAGVYGQFLDGISSVISLDVGLVLSGSCLVETDFHDRLVVATSGPILVLVALAVLFYLAARKNHWSPEQWQRARRKYFSMALLVTFLVYSSVSSTVFRVFDCESLGDGKEYLRADYSIQCTTAKHKALKVYAGFMIMLYPIGIPLLYGIILFKHREVLQDGHRSSATQPVDVEVTSDLWKPYRPKRYYYEVVECARRVTLTGVVVFIYPNTAAQVAVTLVLAFVFVMVSESLAPYASKQDAWLSRVGHIVVFLSMYQALVLKVDVSNESRDSQQVFGGVLLAANICMVAAVIAEATMVVCYVCGRGNDDLEESVAPGLRTTAGTRSVADNWDTSDIEDDLSFKGAIL